jgi:hypothetical protein
MVACELDVTPLRALIDEPVSIAARGLKPWQVVSVRAWVQIRGGTAWISHATFVADRAGGLDLATAAPIAGTYRTADANGLIWSLAVSGAGERLPASARFIESSLAPYDILFSLHDVDGNELASRRATRLPMADDICRRDIRENGIVGTLFHPQGARRRVGIVVVPGSNGGLPEHLAALYASKGYSCLALAYFAADGLPDELMRIPLEYFENALAWFAAQPEVDETAVVMDGTSRGGELALLLGSMFVHRAFGPPPEGNRVSAWTWRGRDLPFVPPIRRLRGSRDADLEHGIPVPHVEDVNWIVSNPEFENARIPVEKIGGPILLLSGRDDVMWPSATYCDWIVEHLRDAGFAHEVRHLSYENAGHTIGPPVNPATELCSYAPCSPRSFPLGGTPEGIARARTKLWPEVLAFLEGVDRRRPGRGR